MALWEYGLKAVVSLDIHDPDREMPENYYNTFLNTLSKEMYTFLVSGKEYHPCSYAATVVSQKKKMEKKEKKRPRPDDQDDNTSPQKKSRLTPVENKDDDASPQSPDVDMHVDMVGAPVEAKMVETSPYDSTESDLLASSDEAPGQKGTYESDLDEDEW
jgi:hypothetical protein